jgi:hypothetical protein
MFSECPEMTVSDTLALAFGLLRELLPIAVLVNPKSPGTEQHLLDVQSAARSLGV